jgi:hypothetical protein
MTDIATATPAEPGDISPVDPVSTPTESTDASIAAPLEPVTKPDPKDRKLAEIAYKERELRRQNARLMSMLEQQQAQAIQQAPKPPKLDDFPGIDEYFDAKLAYHEKQRQPTQQSNAQNNVQPVVTQADFESSRDELFSNGIAKHPDFEDVVSGNHIQITPQMASAIFELDDPGIQVDTTYYLGSNPKEAARIAKLSLVRQVAEITRIAGKLEAKREGTIRPSKAPEPIKPVGGKKTSSDEIQDSEPYDQFLKKWNKLRGR